MTRLARAQLQPKLDQRTGRVSFGNVHDAMASGYLDLLDAATAGSALAATRLEAAIHRATRPCPVCNTPMRAGRCAEHGKPAEDDGSWLWPS